MITFATIHEESRGWFLTWQKGDETTTYHYPAGFWGLNSPEIAERTLAQIAVTGEWTTAAFIDGVATMRNGRFLDQRPQLLV